jgi:hypothetical protein
MAVKAGVSRRKMPKGKPWPKGTSGNPKGRPKERESWAAIINEIGALTPLEAAQRCAALAKPLTRLGSQVTLKEAVVISVYLSLLHDPSAGLLNSLMERGEGRLPIEGTMNVGLASPEWVSLRDRLVTALAGHPEARTAILAELRKGDNDEETGSVD